jgi:hypothetical protein
MYNQINANTDIRGTEAKIPPINELFLEASETATINIDERVTLIMYCTIFRPFLFNTCLIL